MNKPSKNRSKPAYSRYDEKARGRTEQGAFGKTGRKTVAVKMPKAYHGFIRSRLLEQLVNDSLFVIYQLIEVNQNPLEVSLEIFKYKFEDIYSDDDIDRLYKFFKTAYWNDFLEERMESNLEKDSGVSNNG